ncbi:MAG TPA: hypothetical protein VNP98_07755 [Chthoniobacterales bacterium]|nr:hypothetical protein [Chthoniobacterales bacterium]
MKNAGFLVVQIVRLLLVLVILLVIVIPSPLVPKLHLGTAPDHEVALRLFWKARPGQAKLSF